jgi:hypothetical protein
MTNRSRRRRSAPTLIAASAVALFALAAVGGCGGGGSSSSNGDAASAPPASGTVDTWVADFKQASATGDCAKFQELGFSDPCSQVSKVNKNVTVTDSATFGSGGVVDLDNGESLVLFVNDGKWSLAQAEQFGHPTVGTTSQDQAPFKTALDGTLDGIRTKNCDELFKYALTQQGQSPQSFCDAVFGADVAGAISANPNAEFASLGGTGDVQFYSAPLPYKGTTQVLIYPVVDDQGAPQNLTVNPALTPPS